MPKATTLNQLELHALKSANYTDRKVAELAEDVAAAIEQISESKGNSGMNSTSAALLIAILRSGVYDTDQSANIDALASALNVEELPDAPEFETIPLSVIHGTAARADGVKLTYDPTQTVRGATNPLAFYVEEGETYTISLASYEKYGFYPQGLSYSTNGTNFTVIEGTAKTFNGDFTRTLAPGWQYADYTFTPDGTYQVIALQFRNLGNTELTADDIAELNELLTVTKTLSDTSDEPEAPSDNALSCTVVLGSIARSDGIKLTYDTTSSSAAIRASINPVAIYVESGKTYKIALSDYSTYGITMQLMTYSAKDTDFTVVEGTQRIINGDFTRTYTSGWKHEDIVYTADGTADIFIVMMAKGTAHNETLTTDDIAALNSMLTVTVE